ncbi:MAG: C-GCAxxG-C-C family protein [Pseudomonadota bacterium]
MATFLEGFNCAQALLSAYGAEFGLDHQAALRISGAFGGGIGRMGQTCGAVTGALMVIGLKYGRTNIEDKGAEEKTYDLVQEFVTRFIARNGSISCRELLGCDLSTPEGRSFAKENKLIASVCPAFVRAAAEIVEQILLGAVKES